MKIVLYIFGALLTIQSAALAGTLDSSTQVVVSAAQSTAAVQLIDQKFEPVYGQQAYQDTCSREVLDHIENRCYTSNEQVCHGGGQVCENRPEQVCNGNRCTTVMRRVCYTQPRTCTNVPRRTCNDYPVYRTDYYSCTRYRTVVVGQRLVKTYQHEVQVVVENPAALGAQQLSIRLNANQNQLSAQLLNSFADHLLFQQVQDQGQVDSGDIVHIRKRIIITHGISGSLANRIFTASIADLQLGFEAAKFRVANAAELAPFLKVAIKLKRNRRIGGDSTLFNGTFTPAQLGLVGRGSDLLAVIPFQKLNVGALSSNRHDIEISISLFANNLLNTADFGMAMSKVVEGKLIGAYPQNL